MQHITDAMIDAHVSPEDARQVMEAAFASFGRGDAAMQERIRTEAGGVKLSTLGAVIPQQGVAGAKVYTTINGQFSFVILIFSAEDGRPLASFDAGAITRLRTAACTTLAAQRLARLVRARWRCSAPVRRARSMHGSSAPRWGWSASWCRTRMPMPICRRGYRRSAASRSSSPNRMPPWRRPTSSHRLACDHATVCGCVAAAGCVRGCHRFQPAAYARAR